MMFTSACLESVLGSCLDVQGANMVDVRAHNVWVFVDPKAPLCSGEQNDLTAFLPMAELQPVCLLVQDGTQRPGGGIEDATPTTMASTSSTPMEHGRGLSVMSGLFATVTTALQQVLDSRLESVS